MKKISAIVVVVICFICCSFGQNNCDYGGTIDWYYFENIPIFDKPNGAIIDSISNDTINEDIIMITIIDSQKDYFKAILILDMSEKSVEGWIKKSGYIGTYARNYSDKILNLYSMPDKNSNVESIVDIWIPELYTITDCKENWVKVELIYLNKKYTGWLERDMQCPNPYTTCN